MVILIGYNQSVMDLQQAAVIYLGRWLAGSIILLKLNTISPREGGALLPSKGKTRITIYIDDAVLDEFRTRADAAGTGYQTMMNEALRTYLAGGANRPVTERFL